MENDFNHGLWNGRHYCCYFIDQIALGENYDIRRDCFHDLQIDLMDLLKIQVDHDVIQEPYEPL